MRGKYASHALSIPHKSTVYPIIANYFSDKPGQFLHNLPLKQPHGIIKPIMIDKYTFGYIRH